MQRIALVIDVDAATPAAAIAEAQRHYCVVANPTDTVAAEAGHVVEFRARDYTSHTEAINAAGQPQEIRRLFWPCNPATINPPDHKACTGEFDYLDGHEVCACECHQPLTVAPDTSVSILAALKFAGTEHEAEAAANLLRNAADYLCNTYSDGPNEETLPDSYAVDLLDDLRDQLQPQNAPTWLVRLFPAVPA